MVLAKKFQSKVTVVHVVPEQLLDLGLKPADIPKLVLGEVSEWFVKKGYEILKNGQALFNEEGVKIAARLIHGDPAEKIISLALDEKYDLMVLGKRGETEAEVSSLGSNAEKISSHAECSLLLSKKRPRFLRFWLLLTVLKTPTKGFDTLFRSLKSLVQRLRWSMSWSRGFSV